MANTSTQFGGFLTNVGTAQQANTAALGLPWNITHMLIGDAGGDPSLTPDPTPDPAQLTLVRQVHRAQLNALYKSPADPSVLVAELVLPPETGGWWIRELGLEDDKGNFIAVAKPPPSYKPLLAQGSGRTQTIRMHVLFGNTANVSLKIDPSIVLATREYVDSRVVEEINKLDNKQSVRVATTVSIALTGLQTVDGVVLVAGDRVLVKNQAVAKDNGIYVAAAGVWARSADADSNAEVTSALLVSVEQGATLADTRWQLVTDGAIVVGTTVLTFQNVTQGFAPIIAPVLVDPKGNTPPQFDNSKALATTEFVQSALGNFSGQHSITALPTTLPVTAAGKRINCSAVGTLTLPLLASVPVGTRFHLSSNAAGSIVVSRQGADSIVSFGSGAVNSLNVLAGSSAVFTAGEVQWVCEEGLTSLRYSAEFGASLTGPTCWQKLPSGEIEQWGLYVAAPSGAEVVITLPVGMLAEPTFIELTFADMNTGQAVGLAPVLQARNRTAGTITVRNLHTAPASFYWKVKGRV